MRTIVKYSLFAFFAFGFLYMAFQLGRGFEAGINENVTITTCRVAGEDVICEQTIYPPGDVQEIYEQLLEELRNPSDKQDWNQNYTEWQEEKVGA